MLPMDGERGGLVVSSAGCRPHCSRWCPGTSHLARLKKKAYPRRPFDQANESRIYLLMRFMLPVRWIF
jgi:hypothetical protein